MAAQENMTSQDSAQSISEDYSRVLKPARVAIYDDHLIAPRIITVEPTTTTEFIQNLAVCINENARQLGGGISYTVILEVTENFIHAQFKEIVVSIFDNGNTIRFTDQGPGIEDISRAVKPGYTSAIEPMKNYIRGVGSGLPIVHDWVEMKNGHVTIDSNIGAGSAVTISLIDKPVESNDSSELSSEAAQLADKERLVLSQFKNEPVLSCTEVSRLANMSPSSVNYQFKKLEAAGLLVSNAQRKREITQKGKDVLRFL